MFTTENHAGLAAIFGGGPPVGTLIDLAKSKSQKPSEPAPQPTGNASGGGYYAAPAAPAAPAWDPADMAYLDDQESRLKRQKDSVGRTLNNGLTRIGDSYNKEVSSANKRRSQALEDHRIKREDTTRDKDSALNKVDTNARTLADSLRRRLGMAAGSSSSAYQIAAPDAVNRQATQQRTGVVENFGENFRDLETSEKRAKLAFEDLLNDLAEQKKTRESDFRADILDRYNSIDESLSEVARQRALLKGGGYNQVKNAMAPFSSAIDSRQGEIDSLFEKYRTPYSVKAIDVKTPQLRDYMVERATIGDNNSPSTDPYETSYFQRRSDDEEEV